MIEFILLGLVLILVIYLFSRKIPPLTYSNWNIYLENLIHDSDAYYKDFTELLLSKNVKGISHKRIKLKKRGALSSSRQYLRISFENVSFDISFYPYALGTYVSSWSYTTTSGFEFIIRAIPIFGNFLHKNFYPNTYYIADSIAMFQFLVHQTQMDVIDKLMKEKGLRSLTEKEKEFKSKSLFER